MKKSSIAMYSFWGSMLLFSAIEKYFYKGMVTAGYNITTLIISAFIIFIWFRLDAEENNYTPSTFLKLGVVAFAGIAVPYYIFRYKGFKRGILSLAKFITFVFAYLICMVILQKYLL